MPDGAVTLVLRLKVRGKAPKAKGMPKAIDFTGRRFGRLVVLARELNDPFGRLGRMWLCACDCGRTEVLAAYRLPHRTSLIKRPSVTVTACEECRGRRICAVCGTGFATAAANACCSDGCYRTHKRRIERECRARTSQRRTTSVDTLPET